MKSIFEKIYSLEKSNKTFSIATIVGVKGSCPRENAKMIVLEDGDIYSTIGGGPLENMVIEEAKYCIKEKINSLVSYRLNKEKNKASITTSSGKVYNLDMLCGGEVDIFIEVVLSKSRVVLIGAGHVNQAISKNLDLLGENYIVADTRIEIANNRVFENASDIFIDDTFTKAIKKIKFEKNDIVIIATHNSDEEALVNIINEYISFIGMIGSKRKVLTIIKNLIEKKITTIENLKKLNAPLGIDIGSETPDEIALSIVSFIMAKRNNVEIKNMSLYDHSKTVVIRGGGDIASGIALSLKKASYNIIILEIENPTVIRALVSFASAVYEKTFEIDGIKAIKVGTIEEAYTTILDNNIAVLVDRDMKCLDKLKPDILIDATLSKKNTDLNILLAKTTIALGPGFEAGVDCKYVIETNRGHNLGLVIESGCADNNTGIPGNIMGESVKRLLKSPCDGIIKNIKKISDSVNIDDTVCVIVDNNNLEHKVKAEINGCVRGLLKNGLRVYKDMKIGDIDPRNNKEYCYTISDKSRALGNTLLALLLDKNK